MKRLYPPLEPYRTFNLRVSSRHTLYVEESGNPNGVPFLFLHGGPGAGCEDKHRRFFNPRKCRIILFDQRGCGRSTPHSSLVENTTQHLINDMETLRKHLAIGAWVIFGGSWGSTLALAYAQEYPQSCLSLILRGIFLCRERDIRWFYQDGARYLFPDLWDEFVTSIPPDERDDVVHAFYKRLTSSDENIRLQSALAWSLWEGKTSNLMPAEDVVDFFASPHTALSLARIECHYFINHTFLSEGQLLDNAECLSGIDGVIVHGRYDVVCPLEQAYLLHRAWPQSTLHIVDNAGHSAFEEGIVDRLVTACDAVTNKLAQ